MGPRDVTGPAPEPRRRQAKAERVPLVRYVVVGEPPLGVAAEEVRTVVAANQYDPARVFDMTALAEQAPAERDSLRVLVVGRGEEELGLLCSPPIRMIEVTPGEVLVLPPELARSSCMSCVVAPAGVPKIFVLDLARVRELRTEAAKAAEDTDP